MKLGRISAMATVGVMILGALVGIAEAGTASASSWTHLCIDFNHGSNETVWRRRRDVGQPIRPRHRPHLTRIPRCAP